MIKNLIKRLYPFDASTGVLDNVEVNEVPEKTKTLQEKLETALAKTPIRKPSTDISKIVKSEMSIFEQSGERPKHLEHLYQSMCTIPPTSVESERAFSAVGLIVTKLRSSLADNTIDALLCLRSHFGKTK